MSAIDGEPKPGNRRTVEGTVGEAMPNAMFAITLANGETILAHVAGGSATRALRILPGDRVTVELSPYDPRRGRITERRR
jgi:translation initiation factor IF-1